YPLVGRGPWLAQLLANAVADPRGAANIAGAIARLVVPATIARVRIFAFAGVGGEVAAKSDDPNCGTLDGHGRFRLGLDRGRGRQIWQRRNQRRRTEV
ncbi:MAG: hypothetical protein KAI25_04285, partial [Hyphomicrobiaceae bacterium]|nr:hypothetical protein [Hyphomicrobiaceae bacterium]